VLVLNTNGGPLAFNEETHEQFVDRNRTPWF
jgi:hypothetical protein